MGTIKKNFLYNLLLTISNILFPVITFPYASRVLGPEGIGKVQFVTNFAAYFVLLAALGIPAYGIREVVRHRADPVDLRRIVTELITINFVTSLLMFIIYASVVIIVPSLYTDRNFYIVAVFMLLLSCCNVDWLFSGLEAFRFIAIRSLIVRGICLLLLFFMVKQRSDDIYYLGISVAGIVLNNLWNLWTARQYLDFSTVKLINLKRHYKPLLLIFSTIAAISVYTILDTIILGFLVDYQAVGYYTAASRIIKITIPVVTALGTVMIPQIANAFKDNNLDQVRELAKHSFDFVIVIGVPVTVGLIALAPELIILFSGREFRESILPMQLFAPVILVIGFSNIWAVQILMPASKDSYVTISVFLGLIASLILNFSLIPHFHYIGATIANLLSETIVMIGLIYFSQKVIKINFDFKLTFQTLAVSILFLPAVYLIRKFSSPYPMYICLLAVPVCGLIYVFLQMFVIRNPRVLNQIHALRMKWSNNKATNV